MSANTPTSLSGEPLRILDSAVPVVMNVVIRPGCKSYVLCAPDLRPCSIPIGLRDLFTLFVSRVCEGAPSEIVPLEELNAVACADFTDPVKIRATDQLRQDIKRLREHLNEWAAPPKGHWIRVSKKRGYFLNDSVEWRFSRLRRRRAGREYTIDPQRQASVTQAPMTRTSHYER